MGDMIRTNIFTITEESTDMTLFDCCWVPCSTRFVVAGTHTKGHGILRVYTMCDPSGLQQLVNIERKRHPFKCLTFGATNLADRQPATGDFDGNINVWDLENKMPVWSVKGHSSIVNAIDGVGGEAITSGEVVPEIVSGSRDGSVKVWDTRINDRAVASMHPVEGSSSHDCWSVAFGNSSNPANRMVAAGFDNGDIKIFDLRTMTIYWETHVATGVCSVAFDSSVIPMSKLSATCLQGRAYIWDLAESNTNKNIVAWTGNVENGNHTVWGGRFLPQNKDTFVTIGGSGAVKLWKYKYPKKTNQNNLEENSFDTSCRLEKLQECQIAEQPIAAFDWSPDKIGLAVSTAFDQRVRLLAFTNLDRL